MSFSFDFHAKPLDVPALLERDSSAQHAPECVKEFVRRALSGLSTDLVHVHAHGHLFNQDYQLSNAVIEVTPITIAVPK